MVESADIGWRKQVKNCLSCHNCDWWKNLILSVLCQVLTTSLESQEMYFVFLVS